MSTHEPKPDADPGPHDLPAEDAPTDPGPPTDSLDRARVNLLAEAREGPDPIEEPRGVPILLGILVGAVAVWGAWYMAMYGGFGLDGSYGDARTASAFVPPDRVEEAGTAGGTVDGKVVYEQVCVACHQGTGLGVAGAFPPLDGSEWVAMDGRIPASIVLHGLMGEIEVKGTVYNGAMPAFGEQLSDEEIAAVVTYVRGAWSNDAPAVTVEEVRAARGLAEGPIGGGAGLRALLEEGG